MKKTKKKHTKKGTKVARNKSTNSNIKKLKLKSSIFSKRMVLFVVAFGVVGGIWQLYKTSASEIIEPLSNTVEAGEGSGLVSSKQYDGVFWWIRDGGPATAQKPREAIYAAKFAEDGKVIPVKGTTNFPFYMVNDVKNSNWEDIAIDDDKNLWIGDIGANNCGRTNQKLMKVREPDPKSSTNLDVTATYTFSFPDPASGCNTWNSEAMFWLDGKMYIFAKTKNSPVYRVDLPSGNSGRAKLVRLGTLSGGVSNISASSISSDRTRLMVASHNRTNIYQTTKTNLEGDDLVKELISNRPTYTADFDCNCSNSTNAVEGGSFRHGTLDVAYIAETKYLYYTKPFGYGDKDTPVAAPTGDTTKPTVAIASPSANAEVSGTITIEVSASDNVAVTRVVVYHSNNEVIRDSNSIGSYGWGSRFDTRALPNGSNTLRVVAYDSVGNFAEATRQVTVNNATETTPEPDPSSTPADPIITEIDPISYEVDSSDSGAPSITVNGPNNGDTVSGTITIDVDVTDDSEVASVNLYYDYTGVIREGTSQGRYGWGSRFDTRNISNGEHTILIQSTDTAGNVNTRILNIIVNN